MLNNRALSPTPRRPCSGLTITETLTVLAMVALLVAIALPNLTDARQRADVAGVKEDFRQIATALDAYRLDIGAYPRASPALNCVRVIPDTGSNSPTFERLTTPIAYLAGVPPFTDQFPATTRYIGVSDNPQAMPATLVAPYFYTARHLDGLSSWNDPVGAAHDPVWYFMESAGPDAARHHLVSTLDNAAATSDPAVRMMLLPLLYDPTNGTNSTGSIWHAGGAPAGKGAIFADMINQGSSSRVTNWRDHE